MATNELVVALSTQDNENLLEQLKSGFKRTINWNKYQAKVSTERLNRYLHLLIDPNFQGVDRLLFYYLKMKQKNKLQRYYLPTKEIKSYNVMIDGQNFFDQTARNNLITYDNNRKISTGPGMITQLVVC